MDESDGWLAVCRWIMRAVKSNAVYTKVVNVLAPHPLSWVKAGAFRWRWTAILSPWCPTGPHTSQATGPPLRTWTSEVIWVVIEGNKLLRCLETSENKSDMFCHKTICLDTNYGRNYQSCMIDCLLIPVKKYTEWFIYQLKCLGWWSIEGRMQYDSKMLQNRVKSVVICIAARSMDNVMSCC